MPSVHVTATDRPVYFACEYGGDVRLAGVLTTGGKLATPLVTVHDSDELSYLSKVAGKRADYNPLPDSGEVVAGGIYGYGDGLVIVRQTHNRTVHEPADVPALFSVYRPGTSGTLDWIANEPVLVGTRRTHDGSLYRARQAHTTQADWRPDITPALWEVVEEPGGEIPAWVQPTGAHNAYALGDRVTYQGQVWQSTINANVWPPGTGSLWVVVP